MGECIIARSGSGSGGGGIVTTNLPILNENYPADGYFKYNVGISLSCMIDMYPVGCLYQWYVDNQPIDGATQSTFIFTGTNEYKTHSIFCKVSNDLGSVYSRTASILEYPEVFYITNGTECNIPFDNNFLAINYKMRLASENQTSTRTTIPFLLYNKISFNIASSFQGVYTVISINGASIGIIDSRNASIYDITSVFDISEINKDAILKLDNTTGTSNIFFTSICLS